MSLKPKDPLLSAGRIIILIAQGFLGLGAIAITIGLPVLIFARDKITAEMQEEMGNAAFQFPLLEISGVLLLALAIIAMAFVFLGKLRSIINTVGEGDPFVPENAERLTMMAWLMLAMQVVAIPAAGLALYIAKLFEEQDATVDAGFDLTGIILIITLFILARVFRHGTAMREDLEGTV